MNMQETFQDISLRELRKLVPQEDVLRLGDDFFIMDARYNEKMEFLRYPCRIDAYISIFCVSGELDVEANLNVFTMRKNTLLVCTPGNIVRVIRKDNSCLEKMEFTVVACSVSYLSSISIDLKKVFDERLDFFMDPCLTLGEDSLRICGMYLSLCKTIMNSDLSNLRESVGALISSLFYSVGGLMEKESAVLMSPEDPTSASTRRTALFQHFMGLLNKYHTSQRSVGFYASLMGLTPKYLSKLVRQVSGRSAPDWIDSYVILEARNMLKYSDLEVKEIAFRLNFSDTSVFHKFFKSRTGQTPGEYRRC